MSELKTEDLQNKVSTIASSISNIKSSADELYQKVEFLKIAANALSDIPEENEIYKINYGWLNNIAEGMHIRFDTFYKAVNDEKRTKIKDADVVEYKKTIEAYIDKSRFEWDVDSAAFFTEAVIMAMRLEKPDDIYKKLEDAERNIDYKIERYNYKTALDTSLKLLVTINDPKLFQQSYNLILGMGGDYFEKNWVKYLPTIKGK